MPLAAMNMHADDLSRMNRVLRHRLRNSAAGIKSSVTLLADELEGVAEPDILEYFPLIQRECDRLTEVTDRMNALFDESVPENPDVDGSLADGCDAGRLVARAAADLQRRFPGTATSVQADPSAAGQPVNDVKRVAAALRELSVNAAEAAGRAFAVEYYARADGDTLCLGVRNSGPAVAADAIPEMLLPFFTTKSRHIGIGLNLARRYAASCGGELRAQSNADGGMTVELRLPAGAGK
jgi:signal transduction histidine kinase